MSEFFFRVFIACTVLINVVIWDLFFDKDCQTLEKYQNDVAGTETGSTRSVSS